MHKQVLNIEKIYLFVIFDLLIFFYEKSVQFTSRPTDRPTDESTEALKEGFYFSNKAIETIQTTFLLFFGVGMWGGVFLSCVIAKK